ncbi:MAG: iron ABC transporter permease [Phycisphaerales bacterium]|nr:iron ABC transporter permease [Phycisphaerales bacterium]
MIRRHIIAMVVLAATLLAAVLLRLGISDSGWQWPGNAALWELRGIRVVCGLTVGLGLSTAGVLLQALLRNPLASPDLIGVSSGASLAVVLALFFVAGGASGEGGGGGFAIATWHSGPAFVGAAAALWLVYGLSQRRGLVDPTSLVLIGLMLNIMFGAGILLLQHLAPGRELASSRYLVGSITENLSWRLVGASAGVTTACVGVAAILGKSIDAAMLGDDEARSVGVRVGGLRVAMLALAGVLAAIGVTLAGPIGFVGLICPHLARLLTGLSGGHRVLVAAAALAGASTVVLGDSLVRAVAPSSGRLPLGVVMALIGGPVFIAMLRREQRRAT